MSDDKKNTSGDLSPWADDAHGWGSVGWAGQQGYSPDHRGDRVFTGNLFPTDLVERQAIKGADLQALGELHSNMVFGPHASIDGVITFDGAKYYDSLGAFTIKANGTIGDVQVLDSSIKGFGTTQDVAFHVDSSGGAKELGFFVLADGGLHDLKGLDLSTGSFSLVYDYGQSDQRAAKVTDDGSHVNLVFTDAGGADHVSHFPLYYTTDRGGTNALNSDGMVHTISGVDPTDPTTLKIGFEDLPSSTSDKDYNDVVFGVQITNQHTVACGDDHSGSCSAHGTSGSDNFVLNKGCEVNISNFTHGGANGDHIDLSNLLSFNDSVSNAIANFVQVTSNNNGTSTLSVSATGQAADFHAVAMLDVNLAKTPLTTLIADGTIVTHHS